MSDIPAPRSASPRGRPTGRTWLILAAAIAAEVIGALALKGSEAMPALLVVTVMGFVAATVLLAAVLRAGMSLGVAYGIWGATDVTLTALGAAVLFDERVTPVMWLGIALVAVGVVLVEFGSGHHTGGNERAAQPEERGAGA